MAKRKTKKAVEITDGMIGDDEELRRAVEEETIHSRVAGMIFEARQRAGLTQKELAERVGSQQPVIARLENADYGGHSLSMLIRIAAALDNRLVVEMVPKRRTRRRV